MTTERPIEIEVLAAVHASGLLEPVDYGDAHSVQVDGDRTPEQVLRGFLRDAFGRHTRLTKVVSGH